MKVSRKADDSLWCPDVAFGEKPVNGAIPKEWSAFKGYTGQVLANYGTLEIKYDTLLQCWTREQEKRGQ